MTLITKEQSSTFTLSVRSKKTDSTRCLLPIRIIDSDFTCQRANQLGRDVKQYAFEIPDLFRYTPDPATSEEWQKP